MGTVLALPIKARWLFTVEVEQVAGHSLNGRLIGVNPHDIRDDEEPADALRRIADMLREAANSMEAEAALIGRSLETA